MMGGRGTGFAGGLGWLFPLVFWGGIITAIVLLIRGAGATSKTSPPPSGETALDVLKKRYASSEITKEEFEEKKKDLL
ncbi:MAG: SHOCT domain-containing protein [Chloroflexi bacterium]|nr:SHOCT domain-containing protein [Chloroflexota bacterium]